MDQHGLPQSYELDGNDGKDMDKDEIWLRFSNSKEEPNESRKKNSLDMYNNNQEVSSYKEVTESPSLHG